MTQCNDDRAVSRRSPFVSSLAGCERGATAVEYGLILALIVIAMISALSTVASKTNTMWGYVANEVNRS